MENALKSIELQSDDDFSDSDDESADEDYEQTEHEGGVDNCF